MAKLKFDAKNVARIVAHTLAAPEQSTVYGEPVKAPSVLLVKDQGIYLMSNGLPREMVAENKCFVAHAEGFDPDKDEDFYEASRDAVGGDDFAEPIPAEAFHDMPATAKTIILSLTKTRLTVSYK